MHRLPHLKAAVGAGLLLAVLGSPAPLSAASKTTRCIQALNAFREIESNQAIALSFPERRDLSGRLDRAALLRHEEGQYFSQALDLSIPSSARQGLDVYRASTPLGSGANSLVFVGKIPEDLVPRPGSDFFTAGMTVAIKAPKKRVDAIQSIHHEAVISHALSKADPSHRMIRAQEDARFGILVSEYLPGHVSLETWLSKNDSSTIRSKYRSFSSQLTQIKKMLRNAGVVHGDLCPENLLVSPQGDLKVIDYGLASFEGEFPAHLAHRSGHFGYTSPNQSKNGLPRFGDDEFAIRKILKQIQAAGDPE